MPRPSDARDEPNRARDGEHEPWRFLSYEVRAISVQGTSHLARYSLHPAWGLRLFVSFSARSATHADAAADSLPSLSSRSSSYPDAPPGEISSPSSADASSASSASSSPHASSPPSSTPSYC